MQGTSETTNYTWPNQTLGNDFSTSRSHAVPAKSAIRNLQWSPWCHGHGPVEDGVERGNIGCGCIWGRAILTRVIFRCRPMPITLFWDKNIWSNMIHMVTLHHLWMFFCCFISSIPVLVEGKIIRRFSVLHGLSVDGSIYRSMDRSIGLCMYVPVDLSINPSI